MSEKLKPVHPGEVLREEFLKPMGLSQNRLAIEIGVDARRINEIVHGTRSITADTALRLARYFGTSPQFWMGLQAEYDLDMTSDASGERIGREVRPRGEISKAIIKKEFTQAVYAYEEFNSAAKHLMREGKPLVDVSRLFYILIHRMSQELGRENTKRILGDLINNPSDYSKELQALLGDKTLEEILGEIKQSWKEN